MKKQLLLFVMILLPMVASAHDIEVQNADEVTIYYNYINDGTELEVTYYGNDYIIYSKYTGNVVIPEEVTYMGSTRKVTRIGELGFFNCRDLTSVTIPNSVKSIGECAFYGCSGLTSIPIPNSVTEIGEGAFCGCSGLSSITIPNSMTSIGDWAFEECSLLTSVTIPNSVTSIGNYAFAGCSGLTSIMVESLNPNYDSRNNCNAIIKTSSNTLIAGCKNTIIPNSVTEIGIGAFYCCFGLTSVTIPNSVTLINGSAFYGCSGLTSVIIPNSVTFVGGSAFYGCSGLTSVTIPNSVTSISYMTFRDCSGLTSVTIPNNVTEIGKGAFWGCSGLTSVTIPSCVTSIGDNAFYGCIGLASVTIPSRVTRIGLSVFSGCSSLTEVTSEIHNPFVIGDNVFEGISNNAILQVPTGEKSKYEAISGWAKNFKEIVETEGNNTTTERTIHVATAGTLADYISEAERYNIDELTLTGELNGTDFRLLRDMAGNDYMGQETEGRLTVLDLSNAKIVAGGETYLETKSLNGYSCSGSGNFHFSVSYNNVIPQYVFYLCNLKIVNIPNSVTKIEDGAFLSCSRLTSVTIPNGVTFIGSQAFDSCRGLAFVTIPNSVTSIGFGVFAWCRSLTSVTIPNSVTSIGERAFYGCSGLTSVTIPNSVTSINREVFYMCSGLTSVTIPNSVTSIEKWAFRFCSGLTSVTIGSGTKTIGYETFASCSSLTDVYCLATNVPGTNANAFDASNIANAALHVPAESVDAYKAVDPWKNFKEILPLGETIKMAVASGDRTAIGYSSANGLDFTNVTDVKAWVVTGFTADATVLLSRVKIVPPNTGLYLTSDVAGVEVNVPTTDRDVYYANLLLAAVNEETIDPTEVHDGVEYTNFVVGKLNSGEMGFVRVKNTRTLGPNKSRLLVPSSYYPVSNQAPELQVTFTEDASTTDLRGVDVTRQSDSHIFDLQGRKLSVGQAKKGIYIYKGKKYVKK